MNARWAASVSLSVVLHMTVLCLVALFWSVRPIVFTSPQSITVTLRSFPMSAPETPPSQKPSAPEKPIPKKTIQKTPVPKMSTAKPSPLTPTNVTPAPETAASAQTRGASLDVPGGASSGVPRGARDGISGAEVVDVSSLSVSRRVKPDYPAIARRRKEEGTVVLLINIDGANVVGVDVEKSSGFSSLDSAAVAAVKKWRFDNRGKIVARVPVTFQLR